MSVDDYIKQLDSPLREICEKLRTIITNSDKNMVEDIKWNVPVFSINKNICSIMAHKKHVNLQIFQGAHIEDANKLDGSGKDMRHLKLTALEGIVEKEVKRYLKQAIQLDRQNLG